MASIPPTANEADSAGLLQACLDHASALIESARSVEAAGHHNIAYHLAALALEEIGKRELLMIASLPVGQGEDMGWLHKSLDDHVQKLFWCFFGGASSSERFTGPTLDSFKEFALKVHRTRLAGLYVEGKADGPNIPKDAMSPADTRVLVDLATARLGMAGSIKMAPLTPESVAQQRWFLALSQDDHWKKVIFSQASMDKLAELANSKQWMDWLQEIQLAQEAKNRSMLEAELGKKGPGSGAPKWRFRFRLFSDSHSIRKKVLKTWNDAGQMIQLETTSAKNELVVFLTLPDSIPLDKLWSLAWSVATQFVVALNIGTMGYFWWHRPRQIDSFFDKLDDLTNDAAVELKRVPSLKVDWGAHRTLEDHDIGRTAKAFYLLGNLDQERGRAFELYRGGLTFLSLHDLHWQCEQHVFGNFYNSLKEMMIATGQHRRGDDFSTDFDSFLLKNCPDMDERLSLVAIGKAIDAGGEISLKLTMTQASFMKAFCDMCFEFSTRDLEVGQKFGERRRQKG